MELFTFARIVHIIAVIIWIGGVSMVTSVLIPAIKKMKTKEEQINTFEKIEHKFAFQAKIMTLLTALCGFYMIYYLDAWERYLDFRFWWMHAMTLIWLLFTIVLFILEPLVLHKKFKKFANDNPERAFRIMHRAHWVLLTLSMVASVGAIAGSHGWFFIK